MISLWRKFTGDEWPSNYFRLQMTILRCCGIDLSNKKESALYRAYSALALSLILTVTFLEIVELIGQWGNFNDVSNVLIYLITHITGTCKTLLLFKNRKIIGAMMITLQKPPFAPDEIRGGSTEKKLIRATVYTTEKMALLLYIICGVVLLAGPLATLILRFKESPDKWQFPFVLKRSIIDAKTSPRFEIVALTETFLISYFATIIINIDSVLSSIIAQLSTQLTILGNAFRNIVPRAEREMTLQADLTKPFEYYREKMTRDSIKHHLQIYALVDEVEELLNKLLMAILITGMGHLCFLLYSSTLYPTGSIQFFQNIFFWFILVIEDSMFCYWGNELTLCAAALAGEVFYCGWENMPPKIARNVVLVVQRAQRPLFLTAGKFVPVSLQALMAAIKGSFSYFMILRSRQ